MERVFHRTDEVHGEAILREGFADNIGTRERLIGVKVTFDKPLPEVLSPRGEF